MTKPDKTLEAMRRNPQADWTIEDVEAVCRRHGLTCTPPRGGGTHYKVSHPRVPSILTIVARRPVKAVYIRLLVGLIEAVEEGRNR